MALACLKQEFTLGSGASSEKARLESVWRQTGHKPKELDELLEIPESLRFVWEDFRALNSSRTSNGYSAEPLSYTEIANYCLTTQTELQPWEVQIIKYFDATLMNLYAEQAAKSNKSKK